MDNNKQDDLIKGALTRGTQNSVALKDKVWRDIEQRTLTKEEGALKMTVKKKPTYIGYAAAAAALFLTFAAFTPPGQAAVKRIKQVLLPQKQIVERIEGQKENTKVSLQESKIGYTIYFDKDRYHLVKAEGKDRIVPNLKPEPNMPEVYMEIQQITDKTPETVLREIEPQLKAKYPQVNIIGKVTVPIKALLIKANSGNKWNSITERYFLISNGKNGTFQIKQHYFLEAEEGHGARFDNMLKEFRLVTP